MADELDSFHAGLGRLSAAHHGWQAAGGESRRVPDVPPALSTVVGGDADWWCSGSPRPAREPATNRYRADPSCASATPAAARKLGLIAGDKANCAARAALSLRRIDMSGPGQHNRRVVPHAVCARRAAPVIARLRTMCPAALTGDCGRLRMILLRAVEAAEFGHSPRRTWNAFARRCRQRRSVRAGRARRRMGRNCRGHPGGELAGATGLEPATSAVTGQRSDQLSYAPANAPNDRSPWEAREIGRTPGQVKQSSKPGAPPLPATVNEWGRVPRRPVLGQAGAGLSPPNGHNLD